MDIQEKLHLRTFFGLDEVAPGCHLFLPAFGGAPSLEVGINLRYEGHTFASRDAKSASYIVSVLGHAVEVDNIEWKEADEFKPGRPGPAFLFGSRSNRAAEWAVGPSALGRLFHFEYGARWSIRCAGGREFSLPDPSGLSRADYESQTDYGVIGRFRDGPGHAPVFLVAGLGGRATEGCGLYLARRWKRLSDEFQGRDFAVVLKFEPPVDPKNARSVVAYDDAHPGGFALAI